MLDVHVLTLPGLPDEWIEQRRASIAVAVGQAGYPVAVHEIEGIAGHLGRARAIGYAAGTYPYVTHVDHDDYVTPDAFAVLREQIEAGADCITTGETLIYEDGTQRNAPDSRHHLAVYRRAAMTGIDYSRFAMYPDQYLLAQFEPVHIAQCVYMHRLWQDSASRIQRRGDPDAARAELKQARNPELFVAEAMTPAQIASALDAEVAHG